MPPRWSSALSTSGSRSPPSSARAGGRGCAPPPGRRGPGAPRGPGGGGRAPRRRGRLDRVAARLRERSAAGGQARGAREPLPLRGRGARARLGPAVGENILALDIDGPQGAAARLALGGGRDRHPRPARHRAGGDPRAGAARPRRARPPLPDGRGRRPHRHLRPAHRRLRPADRAGAPRRRGGVAARPGPPGGGAPRRPRRARRARSPRCTSLPSGDLRVVLRGPGEVLLFGDAALPPAARDVPEPAPGPRGEGSRTPSTSTCASGAASSRSSPPPTSPPSEPGVPPSLPAAENRPIRPAALPAVSPTAGRARPSPAARPAGLVAASVPTPGPPARTRPRSGFDDIH